MNPRGAEGRSSRAFALFLLGSTAVAACHPTQAEYDSLAHEKSELQRQLTEASGERDRLRTDLDALTTRATDLEHRLGDTTTDRERLQREGAQTQSELEAARTREAELRRRQQQQEARLSVFRNMLEQFRSMISAGQLRVRVVRGRMVIELPAGILFDSGRAELKPEGQQVLTQVATVLRQIGSRDFLVAGHTDNQRIGRGGRYEDNWDLSAARATTVVRFLAQNQVPADHLGAAGYAEFQPARPNDTEENRAQNRRVEIVLMPNIEELPDLSSFDGSPSTPATPPRPATPAPAPAPAPTH
jgi:chemotaxis protein MotB